MGSELLFAAAADLAKMKPSLARAASVQRCGGAKLEHT